MRTLAMVVLGGVAACASHATQIGVRGDEVLVHLDELNQTATAEMQTVWVTEHREAPADRERVFLDQSVTFAGAATSLDKLVAGCPPFAGPGPCLLAARTGELVVLRTRDPEVAAPSHASDGTASTVFGVVGLAAAAGGGVCLAICDSHKGSGGGALLGTGGVFLLLWALTSGARD